MISFILAPLMPVNFKVSPNNVSQQLLLSWEIPSVTNGQIQLYQYCYIKVNDNIIKVNDSNQMCDNTTDSSTKSVNITNLGQCFSLLFVMNCTIWRSSYLIKPRSCQKTSQLICRENHSNGFYPMTTFTFNVLTGCNPGVFN